MKSLHLYKKGGDANGCYLGKIEFLRSGQLASCGTHAKTAERIVWLKGATDDAEQVPIPPFADLVQLDEQKAKQVPIVIGDALKAAGFTVSDRAPKLEKSKDGVRQPGHTPRGQRSDAADHVGLMACADGDAFDAMCVKLATSEDHGVREWYFEKSNGDGEAREVKRIWRRGCAFLIARQIIEANVLKMSRSDMLAECVTSWQKNEHAYRWFHDDGKGGNDELLFSKAIYHFGRIPVQDEFEALESPKVNQRTGEVLPPGYSLGIELDQIRTVDDVVDFFNQRYALLVEDGRTIVLGKRLSADPEARHKVITRSSHEDIYKRYQAYSIELPGKDPDDEPKDVPIAKVWFSSKRAKVFDDIIFHPGKPPRHGVYNLWNGFAVEARKGDWSLLRNHIRDNVCSGNREHFSYLIQWAARLIQQPGKQGEVAVVLRGGEGTGKGFLGRALGRLCGDHGMQVRDPKHLVGHFNGHLRSCIYLFADEAFFAGDKASIGALKSLITEDTLTIEAKHQNAIQTPNFLHVLMASNEKWVVPASADARRFFVLDVSDAQKDNHGYFAAITEQMENGGYEAFMNDLSTLDIKTFNHRAVPKTAALSEQKERSFDSFYQFLRDFLGPQAVDGEWKEWRPTSDLYVLYSQSTGQGGTRYPMKMAEFGEQLKTTGFEGRRDYTDDALGLKKRARGIAFGSLDDARGIFETATGTKPAWEALED